MMLNDGARTPSKQVIVRYCRRHRTEALLHDAMYRNTRLRKGHTTGRGP